MIINTHKIKSSHCIRGVFSQVLLITHITHQYVHKRETTDRRRERGRTEDKHSVNMHHPKSCDSDRPEAMGVSQVWDGNNLCCLVLAG